MKSEADFWSEWAAELAKTRSIPEALSTCQESVAERMQMVTEDGRRLFEDHQTITQ